MMERIKISQEGPELSRLCYGAWRIADREEDKTPKAVRNTIETCLEAGITSFDHADIYGDYSCEEIFGACLREQPSLRGQMELISKAGIKLVSAKRPQHQIKSYDTSYQHLVTSVENSLRHLATDYLDLFLIHRPDPFMDVDDTAKALNHLLSSGKVKHIGVSNFTPSQFQLLDARMDQPLVTNQIQLSPLAMTALHDGTIEQCQRLGISPMAWSPLGGGQLFKDGGETVTRLQSTLHRIGQRYDGAGMGELCLAWLLAHPAKIIPIVGTNNNSRLKALAQAPKLALSREEWFEIWQAGAGTEVP